MGEREHQQDKAKKADMESDIPRMEASDTTTFSDKGKKPSLVPGFQDAGPSASEQAYEDGPGIRAVKEMFAHNSMIPTRVADAIAMFPREKETILAFVRSKKGDDEVFKIDHEIAERGRNKPHMENGGLALHPLAPTINPPMPATATTKNHSTYLDTEEAKKEVDDKRALEFKDQPHNPLGPIIDQKLHGAPPKTQEEQDREKKVTDSLDGGNPQVIHKKLDGN